MRAKPFVYSNSNFLEIIISPQFRDLPPAPRISLQMEAEQGPVVIWTCRWSVILFRIIGAVFFVRGWPSIVLRITKGFAMTESTVTSAFQAGFLLPLNQELQQQPSFLS